MIKSAKDRKIFLSILFLLLFIMLIGLVRSNDRMNGNSLGKSRTSKLNLDNDSLYLGWYDENSYYVGGDGLLDKSDLDSLFIYYNIPKTEVVNLIIGDNISEIGYNCICNYEFLRSLKFDNSVQKIRNGGVRNLNNLQYIFISKELSKVGLDFLYGSDNCTIFTDGDAHSVADLLNIDVNRIVDEVSDYQVVLNAKRNYKTIFPDELQVTDIGTEDSNEKLILPGGHSQYGPYCILEAGNYIVGYRGVNLNYISPDKVYSYAGAKMFACNNIEITENLICYMLELSEDYAGVEFVITNDSDKNVEIDEIKIDFNEVMPNDLRFWFEPNGYITDFGD